MDHHQVGVEVGRPCRGRLWSTAEEVCNLLHVQGITSTAFEERLFQHVRIKAGQRVCRIGRAFDFLYMVKSGFLKTVMVDELGNEQVLGFPMKGDLIGLDGVYSREYMSEAVALSDCELVRLPLETLTTFTSVDREVENSLYILMSREIVRRQVIIGMLGALAAEARVARFLLAMADRFVEMGYSSKAFNLRMTRQEIGSYLGMALETVSRTLSAFNQIGLITIYQRSVGINNPDALKSLRRLPPLQTRIKPSATKRITWLGAGKNDSDHE